MKILVDGYWWRRGPYSNRTVLLEIVSNWNALFPDDELIVAAPERDSTDPVPPPSPGVRIVTSRMRLHPAINLVELPVIGRREGVDAILTFNFSAMSKRGVSFLHDVLPQTNPEWFTAVERAYLYPMPKCAPLARAVITTSLSERTRIVENNPGLKRVVRCGLAVSRSLADASPCAPDLGLSPGSFVACVGRFNIRKNLKRTVDALLQTNRLSADFPLVLIGEPSGSEVDLKDFEPAISRGAIIIASRLTDGELKWIYTHCKFFVCLSLDEGFGLPVVEAASFGAPVLASDIPVFRETVGEHATFVCPTDQAAITAAAVTLTDAPRDTIPYVEQHSWRSVCGAIRGELSRAAGAAEC